MSLNKEAATSLSSFTACRGYGWSVTESPLSTQEAQTHSRQKMLFEDVPQAQLFFDVLPDLRAVFVWVFSVASPLSAAVAEERCVFCRWLRMTDCGISLPTHMLVCKAPNLNFPKQVMSPCHETGEAKGGIGKKVTKNVKASETEKKGVNPSPFASPLFAAHWIGYHPATNINQSAPKEQRRRRAENPSSKAWFWTVHFALCPLLSPRALESGIGHQNDSFILISGWLMVGWVSWG